MSEPITVDTKTFDEMVIKASTPVLVDFWATWCPPCRTVAPMIDELAKEYSGRVSFAKVNVDENPQVAAKYGISAIPTLLLFKDGKPMEQIVGASPKAELKKLVDGALT